MRVKKIKIMIQPYGELKKEWLLAMEGKLHYIQDPSTIFFTSFAELAKVLSPSRMEILNTIAKHKPKSIYDLAKIAGRDFKSVHTDVKILFHAGFIHLKPTGKRSSLKPILKYSGIELDFAA